MRQEQNQETSPRSRIKKHLEKRVVSCQIMRRRDDEDTQYVQVLGTQRGARVPGRHLGGVHALFFLESR